MYDSKAKLSTVVMEGPVLKASKSVFLDVFRMGWKKPYIILLTCSAALGGFLFGYVTGVISGASLYIRRDFPSVEHNAVLQGLIVSMTPVSATIGAALGSWINDRFSRKPSIFFADHVFAIRAVVMAATPSPAVIIAGRAIVGFSVGSASMTAPLYISEASSTRVRGALVSFNGLMITSGQFLAYCINLSLTKVHGNWRWMLGVAGLPALVQLALMFLLPESPRWLYRKGKEEEAISILKKIYTPDEVGDRNSSFKVFG